MAKAIRQCQLACNKKYDQSVTFRELADRL